MRCLIQGRCQDPRWVSVAGWGDSSAHRHPAGRRGCPCGHEPASDSSRRCRGLFRGAHCRPSNGRLCTPCGQRSGGGPCGRRAPRGATGSVRPETRFRIPPHFPSAARDLPPRPLHSSPPRVVLRELFGASRFDAGGRYLLWRGGARCGRAHGRRARHRRRRHNHPARPDTAHRQELRSRWIACVDGQRGVGAVGCGRRRYRVSARAGSASRCSRRTASPRRRAQTRPARRV
mmetsp:Transcript_37692/g.81721  ORF Transcript_37692/g.81721 Transcript_37692/m.81721 type:complete len:232 (-) Transcript_37692:156-851(-)